MLYNVMYERKNIMSKIMKVMDKFAQFGYFFVAICEFTQGNWFSGVGWCLAGVGWFAFDTEKKFFDQANAIYSKCVKEYEDRIDKLEAEKEKEQKSNLDPSIINSKNMGIERKQ